MRWSPAVDEDTTFLSLDTLMENAERARELYTAVTEGARNLSVEDAKEILDGLQTALDQGREILEKAIGDDPIARGEARKALETIQQARDAARECHERKRVWSKIKANSDAILENARRASEIHRRLREQRRALNAADVSSMREDLSAIESEVMGAWNVIHHLEIPRRLRERIERATQSVGNALRDCESTFRRKTEWEQSVAVNVAAVQNELARLEAMIGEAESSSGTPDTGEAFEAEPESPEAALGSVSGDSSREASSGEDRSMGRKVDRPAGQEAPPDSRGSRGPDMVALIRQARTIEHMLRTRRPIDRPHREELNAQLARLAERGGFSAQIHPPQPGSGVDPELQEGARAEVRSLLAEVESLLGIQWPPEPVPARPAAGSSEPSEGLTPAEPAGDAPGPEKVLEDQDQASLERAPNQEMRGTQEAEATHGGTAALEAGEEILEAAAVKTIQEKLRKARTLLEEKIGSHPTKRELWSRFRRARTAFRARKTATLNALTAHFEQRVKEAHRLATEDSPSKARQWIQATQRALGESPLSRNQRGPFLESLRAAWAAAAERQQKLREAQRRHRREALERLGSHFMRWNKRRSDILDILNRLSRQVDTYRARQATSTSIGYRVLAEQRMADLRSRIEELEGVLAELEAKIADVAPRLEAAGWTPPETTEGDEGGSQSEAGNGVRKGRRTERGATSQAREEGGSSRRRRGARGRRGRGGDRRPPQKPATAQASEGADQVAASPSEASPEAGDDSLLPDSTCSAPAEAAGNVSETGQQGGPTEPNLPKA